MLYVYYVYLDKRIFSWKIKSLLQQCNAICCAYCVHIAHSYYAHTKYIIMFILAFVESTVYISLFEHTARGYLNIQLSFDLSLWLCFVQLHAYLIRFEFQRLVLIIFVWQHFSLYAQLPFNTIANKFRFPELSIMFKPSNKVKLKQLKRLIWWLLSIGINQKTHFCSGV